MKVNSRHDTGGKESTTDQVVDWFANVARSEPETRAEQADHRTGSPPVDGGQGLPRWAVGLALLVVAVAVIGWFTVLAPVNTENGETASGRDDESPSDGFGSFAAPYPYGLDVTLGYNDLDRGARREWRVQVLETADEQPSTSQGSTGDTAVTSARIRLTYQDGPANGPATDIRFNAIGDNGEVYPAKIEACTVGADRVPRGEVALGEAVEGWVCWPVPAGAAPPSIMAVVATPADGVLYMNLKPIGEEGS